ncbi:MAG: hypothetical protein GX280_08170 [Lentisphaerae bacterium]|nr:hypothetical protein [Lentisphaerota bacterium]
MQNNWFRLSIYIRTFHQVGGICRRQTDENAESVQYCRQLGVLSNYIVASIPSYILSTTGNSWFGWEIGMRNPSQQENSFCYRLSQVNENVDYWLAFKTANAEIGSMKPINN